VSCLLRLHLRGLLSYLCCIALLACCWSFLTSCLQDHRDKDDDKDHKDHKDGKDCADKNDDKDRKVSFWLGKS